jgi:photosystem II stability/assembly factor-like uncharacterized protein
MRPYLLALFAGAALALPAPAADLRYFDDASLHAVQFIDADVGWAVGDEGVVWKTIDGGTTWERQPTGVRGSLRSLHALTPLVVWVAGREELPGGGSTGVVLFTRDGGEKWVRLFANTLPGLNCVRFGDANNGCFVGDSSDQYPTGVFLTSDGGRNLRAVKGARCTSWLGADFQGGKTGALTGAWSRLGTLRDGSFGKADVDQFGGRNLCSIQLRAGKSFAVGQGGLVLHSKSLGEGWDFNNTKLPEDVVAAWDFHAVAVIGDKVWVAGRPGSAILCSDDKGSTWKINKTGQPLPLNGLSFFDEKRGWAVGELGCILVTTDGGQTWKVQRRGGQRAAVLCVTARAQDLPVDTVAMLGGEQGLLTAAVRVAAPDPKSESLGESAQPLRFAAAHRLAGGAAAETLWQFPLPQHLADVGKEDLLMAWDRLHGEGRAAQQLLRQLVLAIRIWRPDVVLTDHPTASASKNTAGALVALAMEEAFKKAADPKAFPEQIELLGLEAWRVTKLYGLWDQRDGAHVIVDTGRDGARLLATFAEFAAGAAQILTPVPPALPTQRCYRLLGSTVKDAAAAKDLLDGVTPPAVGVCRRELAPLEEPSAKLVEALKAQRRLQDLVKDPANGLVSSDQLLGQLGTMLAKLPEDRGAKAAFAVANAFARQGQWPLAREAFLEMVQRYPLNPLSADAYRWLIRHNSSSEAHRRFELGQFLVVSRRGDEILPVGNKEKSDDPKTPQGKRLSDVSQGTFLGNPADLTRAHQGSLLLAKRLVELGPVFSDDPGIQFCLQASKRQLGKHEEALDFYKKYCGDHEGGVWRDLAAQEIWLASRFGPPPRAAGQCFYTDKKPFLDGKLDEDCWQSARPLALKNAVNDTAKEYPTEAKLAYDDKFLYVALKCKHPAGQGEPAAKERPRDADLRAFDRVSIMLDLDRDYSTYFHLQVDQRGCVCEDCWGDTRWNPQWFVAIRSEDDCWQVEAAIPLAELTGDRLRHNDAWAVNVVRVLPGRGVQAWSTPAGVEPRPEGMGLVVFQREQPAAPAAPKMP